MLSVQQGCKGSAVNNVLLSDAPSLTALPTAGSSTGLISSPEGIRVPSQNQTRVLSLVVNHYNMGNV